MNLFAGRKHLRAEAFQRQAEDAPRPLLIEVLINLVCGGRSCDLQLFFGAVEVERDDRRAASPFYARRGFVLISNKAVQTGAKESPELCLRWIEAREEVLLDRFGEEALCQIASVFGRFVPLDSDVLIDRHPVSRYKRFECTRPFFGV